jgi:hypothetical protein
MDTERKKIKLWIETWKHASSAMEKERHKRLREYDYLKNLAVIDEMLKWACANKKLRLTSGLVDQQRYFMKLRDKNLGGSAGDHK